MDQGGNSSRESNVDRVMAGDDRIEAKDTDSRPVVMKFGGSSVADLEGLRRVAAFVVSRASMQPVVVVVSAMGKTTTGLVEQARTLHGSPSPREMDMLLSTGERVAMSLLAIAIQAHGCDAVSLTGSQCGIITDHRHGQARVMEVRPFRILDELAAGRVVIVGGFQGVSYKREVTTLGRGGSDTTAVALAAALAGDCEIYSDVDGVYSADPRVVASARRLDELDHAQMRALSRAGAKVLHARAVELAQERGVAIYARATPSGAGSSTAQTVVRSDVRQETGVRAVACDKRVFRVSVRVSAVAEAGVDWRAFAASLGALGLRHLEVGASGARGLLSATQRDDAVAVVQRVHELVHEYFPDRGVLDTQTDLALVSCIGCGLDDRGDLLGAALGELAAANVLAESVHVEADCIAFVVSETSADLATRTLHDALVPGSAVTPGR